jgi:MFS family permease
VLRFQPCLTCRPYQFAFFDPKIGLSLLDMEKAAQQIQTIRLLSLPVVVAALGFFIDVYDLLLFSIIRKASLADLGLNADQIFTSGEFLIGIQMFGLLIGGIFWGILGDKRGRLSVLFGSILLYSLANAANGLVQTTTQYAWLRFIAGLGLAGELGAGVTLVIELLPKEKRGIGAAIVAGFGILGAVMAFFVSRFLDWRMCFFAGGIMGMLLLALRIRIYESSLYDQLKKQAVSRGNFMMFFTNRSRLIRYIRCVLIGIPAWFIIGVLVTFSDKFSEHFGIPNVDPGRAVMFTYLSIAFGDFTVGLLSNYLRSRKKALFIFYGITAVFMTLFFTQQGGTANGMYLICAGLGYGAGFTVVYITMSAEQFGTNLRATAAVSIPNMVRGALPLILLLFHFLRDVTGNLLTGAIITAAILLSTAVVAAIFTEDTFGKNLDFIEE